MKKIIVINTSGIMSGAEFSLLDLLVCLRRSYDILVVLPEKNELYDQVYRRYETRIFNLTTIKRSDGLMKNLVNIFKIFRTSYCISKLITKQHVNFIYANNNKSMMYAIPIGIFSGRKIIWHVRDNIPNKLIGKLFGMFSTRIVSISNYINDQLSYISAAKRTVVYNGIDTDLWIPSQNEGQSIRKMLKMDKDKLIIAQIGQLTAWKNPIKVIDVAAGLIKENQNVHFILIGRDHWNSDSKFKNHLLKKIHEKELQHNFTVLDFNMSIREMISEIDILLHLAVGEPFGRVLIEAMALEKPIVAIKSGGVTEIVSNDRNGYLISGLDLGLIVANLKFLCENPSIRFQFGKHGRKVVETKFNITNYSKIANLMLEID